VRLANGVPDAEWVYDNPVKGMGLIDFESGGDDFYRGYTYDTYDHLFRPVWTLTRLGPEASDPEACEEGERCFLVGQAWDGYYSRLKGMWYPTAEVIEHRYDAYGYSLGETDPATDWDYAYRQTIAVNAAGQVTRERFGNGVRARGSWASTATTSPPASCRAMRVAASRGLGMTCSARRAPPMVRSSSAMTRSVAW
jgi:hypothetical protein